MNGLKERTEVLPLRWGVDVHHLKPPFDLVLACDVAYDLECVSDLLTTFAALCGPSTRGYLAYEERPGVYPAASPTETAVAALPSFGIIATEVGPLSPHSQTILTTNGTFGSWTATLF